MPTKPTTLAVKAVESSEFKQATSNGIAKELKSSSTELMVETKDRASARKETLYITREAKDSKQGQHQEAIAVSPPEPKEGKKGSQVLQKTSSTITLQAVKLQPEPKAEPQATFIRQSEDRRRAVQPLVSAQQTLSLTGQLSQRSREGENRSGARKTVMEEKREPLGIPPQFESCPQSLEASEGQEIKFRSKGKEMKVIRALGLIRFPFYVWKWGSNSFFIASCPPPKTFWKLVQNLMLFPQYSSQCSVQNTLYHNVHPFSYLGFPQV